MSIFAHTRFCTECNMFMWSRELISILYFTPVTENTGIPALYLPVGAPPPPAFGEYIGWIYARQSPPYSMTQPYCQSQNSCPDLSATSRILINPFIDSILAWLAPAHENYTSQLAQKTFTTLSNHLELRKLNPTPNPAKFHRPKAKKLLLKSPRKGLLQILPKVHSMARYHS